MIRQNDKTTSLTEKVEAAFDQASRKVIRRTQQSGTPIVVWKNGQIKEIPVKQAERALVKDQPGADNT